jgi:signal transduction histidine kinase
MDSLSQEVIIIVIGCAFFLLVAIGIIILILIYQKKQILYIYEKKELQNQYKEEILRSQIEAQEKTLSNMGKEIHDNIGQLLSSAKMLLGVAVRKMPDVGDTLQQSDQSLSKAIIELRALSKSLSSEWLEQFSLYENLETEARRINSSGEIKMSVVHEGTLHMDKDRQLMLFRMVQEAFQNSLKHGKATQISILVKHHESNLTISIQDNGNGFDATDEMKQGFGMLNMKHRASVMGGQALWKSDSTGTIVTIQTPLQNET